MSGKYRDYLNDSKEKFSKPKVSASTFKYDPDTDFDSTNRHKGTEKNTDYKFILAQRDSELYSLRQNYELQCQESQILKQKLIESVDAYELLSLNFKASEKSRGIVFFELNFYYLLIYLFKFINCLFDFIFTRGSLC